MIPESNLIGIIGIVCFILTLVYVLAHVNWKKLFDKFLGHYKSLVQPRKKRSAYNGPRIIGKIDLDNSTGLMTKEDEITQLYGTVQEYKHKLKCSQDEFEAACEDVNHYKSFYSSQIDHINELSNELSAEQSNARRWEAKYRSMKQDYDEVFNRVEELSDKLETVEADAAKYEQKIWRLQDEVMVWKDACGTWKNQNKRLLTNNKVLREKVEDLIQVREDMSKDLKQMQKYCDKFRADAVEAEINLETFLSRSWSERLKDVFVKPQHPGMELPF